MSARQLRIRWASLALASSWCVACMVGEPLVDERQEVRGVGFADCAEPPLCEPRRHAPQINYAASPIVLEECGGRSPCIAPAPGSEAAPVCSNTRPAETLPQIAECTALELVGAPDDAEYHLDSAQWNRVNLVIRAEQPRRVTLVAPALQGVYVQLIGPVLLRIVDTSLLEELRLVGMASAAGRPRVEFERVHGQALRVGDNARSFGGEIAMHATAFTLVAVHAESVTLESAVLDLGGVRADLLTVADADLNQLVIESETAVISTFVMEESHLLVCKSGSLFGGRAFKSSIRTCPFATTRLYDVTVVGGELNGAIEADSANLENLRVGTESATQLTAFASYLSSVNFCEHSERLALGALSILKCSACDDVAAPENLACALPELERLGGNFCPAWPIKTRLPECSDDVSPRTRPRSQSGN